MDAKLSTDSFTLILVQMWYFLNNYIEFPEYNICFCSIPLEFETEKCFCDSL